jgi:hypothetical protein
MKSNARLAGLLGIILAVVLAIAWKSHVAARQAEDSVAALSSKRVALQASLQHLQKSVTFDERDNEDTRNLIAEQKHPRGTIRVTPRITGPQILALVASDPKLFALGMKAYRATVNTNFGRLFRTLNLTPDQIDKFDSLATSHMEAIADILSSATTEGLPMSDPAVGALMRQENSQYQAAQQALLGDAGYQQMQQFNRQQPVTGVVQNVAAQVALTSTPLSAAQADQLTQILANSSPQFMNGGVATPNTINWQTALGQAQAILNPVQFAALQGRYNSIQVNQLMTQFNAQEKGN